jgi:hypothetical protein
MALTRTNWDHSRKFLAVEARRETKMPAEGELVAKRHVSLHDVTCGPGKKPGTLGQGAGDAPAKTQGETKTPSALVTGRQLRGGGRL